MRTQLQFYYILILFSSILANTLLGSDSRLIPPFQSALHSISTPASPAAFIFSMVIPSIPCAFPVFADFSDSSTSDHNSSG